MSGDVQYINNRDYHDKFLYCDYDVILYHDYYRDT